MPVGSSSELCMTSLFFAAMPADGNHTFNIHRNVTHTHCNHKYMKAQRSGNHYSSIQLGGATRGD
jgi:hypothetical protein